MAIKLVKGNIVDALIKGDIDIFAHGVNCMGGFGSGLAREIKQRLSPVRLAYLNKYSVEGWGLGQTQVVKLKVPDLNNSLPREIYVMNCATQKNYGKDPQSQPNNMYCSYEAIRDCMHEYHEYCVENKLIPGLPYIGCGLAGGDWNEVSKIIEEIFDDITICVYYL